jgi:4-amino-4-deoxy-L-arabinose transferase-like glycosyltransferase
MPAPKPATGLESGLARPPVEATLVVALVLLSFGLRVAYVLQSRSSPLFDAPQMDALYHVEWARAFARGAEFQDGPFFRAPLYPWALGIVFALFGDGLLLPRLLQAALGAVCTLLVYGIGRRAFDRRAGALAALLHATSWIAIFYDGELLLEALATPLFLLGLWLALGLAERPAPRGLLLTGLAFGLSAITRPNVLLFLPVLAAWLFLRGARGRAGLVRVGLLALGTLAPILPITAINAAEGDRVLISYQAGVNLWIGNNPHSDGSTAIAPGTRPDWWGGFEDTHAQAAQAEGRELRPSEVSRHYVRRTLAAIGDDPAWWLGHLAWKLRLFWMDWELGNNEEPRFFAQRTFLRYLPVSFGSLAALAAIGLWAARRSDRAHAPLALFALVYTVSVVLFFVNARFRLPVLPVLAVYAAHGAWWIADAFAQRRRAAAAVAVAAVVALALGSAWLVPDTVRRNSDSNGLLQLGQAELRAGDHAAALVQLERALELWPRNEVARDALGFLGRECFNAGDHETAVRAFRSLGTHAPRDFDALFSLGSCELALDRPGPALEAFERALEAPEPDEPRFLYEAYGRTVMLLEQAGRPADALRVGERMLSRFPEDATTLATVRRLRERQR